MTERREAKDGTLYWTLSFYIGHDQIAGTEPIAAMERPPSLPTPFDSIARDRAIAADPVTIELRDTIDPLFNDIADRSRQRRIEDFLFAAAPRTEVTLIAPPEVRWATEGRTYVVRTTRGAVDYPATVQRFWYLHGNGSLSWHLSFAVRYRNDAGTGPLEAAIAAQEPPEALYLLSLLQKLAWPKEFAAVRDRRVGADDLIGIGIRPDGARQQTFWQQVESWFDVDQPLIRRLHGDTACIAFADLCPEYEVNEVPGLHGRDTRSLFFIQDRKFFELIQPKDADGALIDRRVLVRDRAFNHYPERIAQFGEKQADGSILLGPDYWRAVYDEAGLEPQIAARTPAATRLLYLFLAGFNQNIIDWTNQEASEVLDSLDPIYPRSDEQQEEGFFIRYANARSMLTYVRRSRTLEVGNDYIGTCPYAFLIHALSMHNERLTRDQESLAFEVIDKVRGLLGQAEAAVVQQDGASAARALERAEAWVNWYRAAAFELFDRQRYANPFRYDTERDPFEDLETLRGTSRLATALDRAMTALEEQMRDLDRLRTMAEASAEKERADHEATKDRLLTLLFGVIGLSGIGQLAFNIDAYMREDRFADGTHWADVAPLGAAFVITVAVLALMLALFRWWTRD